MVNIFILKIYKLFKKLKFRGLFNSKKIIKGLKVLKDTFKDIQFAITLIHWNCYFKRKLINMF